MHVLFVILITLRSYAVISQDHCFREYGSWSEDSLVKSEYESVDIRFLRYIKNNCRVGVLTLTWLKDGRQMKVRQLPNTPKKVDEIIRFYSLSKSDAAMYTLILHNAILNYTFNVLLNVKNGSERSRLIREHIVPLNIDLVVQNRLYWTPKMIEESHIEVVSRHSNVTLKCMLYSTNGSLTPRVAWYFSRAVLGPSVNIDELGDLLRDTSRVISYVKQIPCFVDPLMPEHSGYCYLAKLQITFFLPIDSGTYSCVVNRSLNMSFVLFLEYNKYVHKDGLDNNNQDISTVALHESISSNKNDSVCQGLSYVFHCSLNESFTNLSLWKVGMLKDMVLLTRTMSSALSYRLNSTEVSDSGTYICRSSLGNEQSTYLLVQQCIMNSILWNVVLPLVVVKFIILLLVFVHYIVMIHRRLILRDKIHSKFKVEGMHRNERYIPLQSDPEWEIARVNIVVFSEMLGSGEYGKVFKGRFKNKYVAVKVAKFEGCSILSQEIEIMKQLEYHQNIIRLLGVCSLNGPLMAVLELAEGGNLKLHLLDHNPNLKSSCNQICLEQLLSYVTQIANGMEFLSAKQVIHRDLAARNCLLTSDMYIKLSDFGLTKLVGNDYLNESEGVKAIAWTAPESLLTNNFTSKSDVWSFGIVMWEVFELGESPYSSLSFQETIEAVTLGVVNPKPSRATDDVYAIMTRCWAKEPNDRPTFQELKKYLDEVDVNEYL